MTSEPYAFQRLLDMLRKLRLDSSQGGSYDATCLLLASATGPASARLEMPAVPDDLGPSRFFEDLLTRVFERLPVSERAAARAMYRRDQLPTVEVSPPDGPTGPPVTS